MLDIDESLRVPKKKYVTIYYTGQGSVKKLRNAIDIF